MALSTLCEDFPVPRSNDIRSPPVGPVSEAKKSRGYSSDDAGAHVLGRTSAELAARYVAPPDMPREGPARERPVPASKSVYLFPPPSTAPSPADQGVGRLNIREVAPGEGTVVSETGEGVAAAGAILDLDPEKECGHESWGVPPSGDAPQVDGRHHPRASAAGAEKDCVQGDAPQVDWRTSSPSSRGASFSCGMRRDPEGVRGEDLAGEAGDRGRVPRDADARGEGRGESRGEGRGVAGAPEREDLAGETRDGGCVPRDADAMHAAHAESYGSASTPGPLLWEGSVVDEELLFPRRPGRTPIGPPRSLWEGEALSFYHRGGSMTGTYGESGGSTVLTDPAAFEKGWRRRRCLYLSLVLLLMAVLALAVLLGQTRGAAGAGAGGGGALLPPLAGGAAEPLSSSPSVPSPAPTAAPQVACPAGTKAFSVLRRPHGEYYLPAVERGAAAWRITDACSGEVLARCAPCAAESWSPSRGSLSQPRSAGPRTRHREESGVECLPADRAYAWEVFHAEEDACCSFDLTAHVILYDNVMISNLAPDGSFGDVSAVHFGARDAPCATAAVPPSAAPSPPPRPPAPGPAGAFPGAAAAACPEPYVDPPPGDDAALAYYAPAALVEARGVVYRCVDPAACGAAGFAPGSSSARWRQAWEVVGPCAGAAAAPASPLATTSPASIAPTSGPVASVSALGWRRCCMCEHPLPPQLTIPSLRVARVVLAQPVVAPTHHPTALVSVLFSTDLHTQPHLTVVFSVPCVFFSSSQPTASSTDAPSDAPSGRPSDTPTGAPTVAPLSTPSVSPSTTHRQVRNTHVSPVLHFSCYH